MVYTFTLKKINGKFKTTVECRPSTVADWTAFTTAIEYKVDPDGTVIGTCLSDADVEVLKADFEKGVYELATSEAERRKNYEMLLTYKDAKEFNEQISYQKIAKLFANSDQVVYRLLEAYSVFPERIVQEMTQTLSNGNDKDWTTFFEMANLICPNDSDLFDIGTKIIWDKIKGSNTTNPKKELVDLMVQYIQHNVDMYGHTLSESRKDLYRAILTDLSGDTKNSPLENLCEQILSNLYKN